MKGFGKISEIDPLIPLSWQNRVFLTFDVDWAHDEILSDTLDLVEQAGVSATFFMTHETPLIERIYENEKLEMGIHPNFNFLLQGDNCKGGTINEVIENVLKFIPNCKSVRSHSITQSGPISEAFRKLGITHESNDYIPEFSGIGLKPWVSANNMIKAPFSWTDEYAWDIKKNKDFKLLSIKENLSIYNFHPIHVFINSNGSELYNKLRKYHKVPSKLKLYKHSGYGTRNRLLDLID